VSICDCFDFATLAHFAWGSLLDKNRSWITKEWKFPSCYSAKFQSQIGKKRPLASLTPLLKASTSARNFN